MTNKLTKKILVTPELVSSAMGSFFEELGYELHLKFITDNEYLFAVDNACPDVHNVPRLKTKDSLESSLEPMVRSYVCEDYFDSDLGKKLLASYFTDGREFDLVDRYSKDFKNIYTVKIHEYLNVGFFVDSIIVEAYKSQFNISILRNYLNAAMNFTFKKVEMTEQSMPIDVSYSHNSEAFTVQISMEVDAFGGMKELQEFIQILTENSNFFDVAYFQKKKKLTLSSLIFKNNKKPLKSFFFTEITKKLSYLEDVSEAELNSGLEAQESVRYVAKKNPDEKSKKLALARKFTTFIRNYRLSEEGAKELLELDVSDIEKYLSFYPREVALKDVDDEVNNLIVKLLKDEALFNSISDYIKKISSENLDSQVQDIQYIFGKKSLNEIEEIMLISGSKEDAEGSIRVKGWVENGDESKWEVKKGQINEKIQDEVIRINSSGKNMVQDDIIRVVAKELDAKETDIKVVVSGIVDEVISRDIISKKNLEEAFALSLFSTQVSDSVKEKREKQILRMTKIMGGLKRELLRLQGEKRDRENADKLQALVDVRPLEELQFKEKFERTADELKRKERFLEKMRDNFEVLNKIKDQKIEVLNNKIEELKADFAKSDEFAKAEKLEKLEAENKTLIQRLELTTQKVNIINENIENRDNTIFEKLQREVESLKAHMLKAQATVERLKLDKMEMETLLKDEKENSRKLNEEKDILGASSEDMTEKDFIINIMNIEKKAMEEKFRTQALELKRTEQKLKFSISQLESSSKRKAPTPSGQKSAEALTKLLDQSNVRLVESAAEITERRKEAIKLKQENAMMSSKIAELEKKLGIVDKKAS